MTARLSRVLENPEKSLSTSLLAFSLMRRPRRVKKPVEPAAHRNRGEARWEEEEEEKVERVVVEKKRSGGGEGASLVMATEAAMA